MLLYSKNHQSKVELFGKPKDEYQDEETIQKNNNDQIIKSYSEPDALQIEQLYRGLVENSDEARNMDDNEDEDNIDPDVFEDDNDDH